jgi:hypothetical protein
VIRGCRSFSSLPDDTGALIAARAELATKKANAVAIDAELAHARVVSSAALRECKCISTIMRSVSVHSTAAEFSTIVQHR